MKVTRRRWLKAAAATGAAIPFVGCERAISRVSRDFGERIPEHLSVAGGAEIDLRHLPVGMSNQGGLVGEPGAPPPEIRPLHIALREFEREYLLRAMAQAGSKRVRAAELLGISRKSLWEKLRLHGISDEETESRELGEPRPLS